ncbi:helix-turn-helix transcriptional regulator [Pseudonocardia sp. TRM90224]|uniref:helix-turn-helix transcriptional regulator n=1 Tax=Pseudonocardia sp. TRM90224 TaxID=2812678 RepID=UPI001E563348|nr:helix-turn-helix transcriptional regulator [Pseudonocardia sp. TRM90224]
MAEPMSHPAVRTAVEIMYEEYYEPITLAYLSRRVFISPFHFSRLFSRVTGATPGRFLTAVRLFEAKRLLLDSDLTVSDVVCAVGYSSVGTFTTRFTRAVGMTPSQYRDPRMRDQLVAISPHYHRLPSLAVLRESTLRESTLRESALRHALRTGSRSGRATLSARIELPHGVSAANVLVCAFADDIPQRAPVAFGGLTGQSGTATVELRGVPTGQWRVHVAAEHRGPQGNSVLTVGAIQRAATVVDDETIVLRMRTRAIRPTDPPIAVTLSSRSGSLTPSGPQAALSAIPVRRLTAV